MKIGNKPPSNQSIPIEEESSLKFKEQYVSERHVQSSKSYNDDDYGFSNNNYNNLNTNNSASNNNILKLMQKEHLNNKSKSSDIKEEVILILK
jgi:hypothetical protein